MKGMNMHSLRQVNKNCMNMHSLRQVNKNYDLPNVQSYNMHWKENPIYVFLFWELRGLSPNFHMHVSMSDLYISRIGPHISLQQNRQTDPGNI
jgi:hypothetical protein